ncbi:MAG: hypothetical protein J6S29_00375 [Methanosphaera sp.]|nr:hypothetical protein [Methanosphaera sp.]
MLTGKNSRQANGYLMDDSCNYTFTGVHVEIPRIGLVQYLYGYCGHPVKKD